MRDGYCESTLKAKQAQDCGGQPQISPPSARGMLLERAEALRREAHDLETLARSLPPEGMMGEQAERMLSSCVAARIYR